MQNKCYATSKGQWITGSPTLVQPANPIQIHTRYTLTLRKEPKEIASYFKAKR
jgi:hypothetical protein